jgi:hypothetical protein
MAELEKLKLKSNQRVEKKKNYLKSPTSKDVGVGYGVGVICLVEGGCIMRAEGGGRRAEGDE